jgi:hypothetical protein
MKDFVISSIALVVLVVLFSTGGVPEDIPSFGAVPKYPGDSGVVISGAGSKIAEMAISESPMDTARKTEAATKRDSESEMESSATSNKFYVELIEEERVTMNEIALAFWHGVAAILIGGTAALMIAIACMKHALKNMVHNLTEIEKLRNENKHLQAKVKELMDKAGLI